MVMMNNETLKIQRQKLKILLLEKINAADKTGKYTDLQYDEIIEAINLLVELTPLQEPINEQEKVSSPWVTSFASFGPKHTAGKPIIHETHMGLLSFNRLPKLPIKISDLTQEIESTTQAYNNVVAIQNISETVEADLIMYGRYSRDEENLKRYAVDFYAVELKSQKGLSDKELREAFDMEEDQALKIEFKVPPLHSDIVYCDETMRINFGSLSGIYVLERLHCAGRSVAFQ
jgi:hypothetical protein